MSQSQSSSESEYECRYDDLVRELDQVHFPFSLPLPTNPPANPFPPNSQLEREKTNAAETLAYWYFKLEWRICYEQCVESSREMDRASERYRRAEEREKMVRRELEVAAILKRMGL